MSCCLDLTKNPSPVNASTLIALPKHGAICNVVVQRLYLVSVTVFSFLSLARFVCLSIWSSFPSVHFKGTRVKALSIFQLRGSLGLPVLVGSLFQFLCTGSMSTCRELSSRACRLCHACCSVLVSCMWSQWYQRGLSYIWVGQETLRTCLPCKCREKPQGVHPWAPMAVVEHRHSMTFVGLQKRADLTLAWALTASGVSGYIFNWWCNPPIWSPYSSFSWSTSFDFAALYEFTLWTEVLDSNELTGPKPFVSALDQHSGVLPCAHSEICLNCKDRWKMCPIAHPRRDFWCLHTKSVQKNLQKIWTTLWYRQCIVILLLHLAKLGDAAGLILSCHNRGRTIFQ